MDIAETYDRFMARFFDQLVQAAILATGSFTKAVASGTEITVPAPDARSIEAAAAKTRLLGSGTADNGGCHADVFFDLVTGKASAYWSTKPGEAVRFVNAAGKDVQDAGMAYMFSTYRAIDAAEMEALVLHLVPMLARITRAKAGLYDEYESGAHPDERLREYAYEVRGRGLKYHYEVPADKTIEQRAEELREALTALFDESRADWSDIGRKESTKKGTKRHPGQETQAYRERSVIPWQSSSPLSEPSSISWPLARPPPSGGSCSSSWTRACRAP